MLPSWRLNHPELVLHSSTDLSGSIRFGSMFIPMSLLWSHSTEHSTSFLLILLASFYSHSHSTPVILLPFYCVLPILWCFVDDPCIRAFYLLRSSPMIQTILLPECKFEYTSEPHNLSSPSPALALALRSRAYCHHNKAHTITSVKMPLLG